MSQGEVVHIVRNYGVLSEAWIPESIAAVERFGWPGWVLATGEIRAGAERLVPGRDRWLAPLPAARRQRVRDRVALRTSADRRGATLVQPIGAVRPALAHAHFGWAAADARRAAAATGVPLVATFHGSDLLVYPGRRRAWDYRRLLRGAAEVIVVSQFLAGFLERFGFRRTPHVIPMGVDLDRLPFRAPVTDRAHVVLVGRLVEAKGADVLVRAIPAVRAAVPEATFEIIGDGPARASCEQLARALGVADLVTFRGALTRADVHDALARAPLVVVPSRTERNGRAEGRSVVAMEAMAVGAAVVASDAGGLPETMPPERRHELVPAGDADALAAAIVQRLSQTDAWDERARAARAWVEQNFAWPVVARRIADVYARVGT